MHVREVGCFDEPLNLLLRCYLWTLVDAAAEHARVKWSLAEKKRDVREGYETAKEPTVWSILRAAHAWAQRSAWRPDSSDVSPRTGLEVTRSPGPPPQEGGAPRAATGRQSR